MASTSFAADPRQKAWPTISSLDSHPLVPKPHGPIFILEGRQNEEWMQANINYSAGSRAPATRADAIEKVNARDRPVFLSRDMDGSKAPEKDKVVVWSFSGLDHPKEDIVEMKRVRADILGDPSKITPNKAKKEAKTGEYLGGIEFERHEDAISIHPLNRAYPVTTSTQLARNMDAPHKGRKTMAERLSSRGKLMKALAKIGAKAGMAGMHRGPAGMKHLVKQRADYLNIPSIGHEDNAFFPTFQLNVASAVQSKDVSTLDSSLGKYGTIHPDCGDTAASVTAMTCLSKPHPDVDPDIFFIQDFGIAIVFQEFDVLYFCGLRYHGGTQPRYRDERTSDEEYNRLTLIGYPSSKFYDQPSSSAFASLPGQPRVLKIFGEMKDYMNHRPVPRTRNEQATYVTDGEALMEAQSHLDYIARGLLQMAAHCVDEAPKHLQLRVDKDLFLRSFSAIIDQVRCSARSWPLGPGWTGSDTVIGKRYKTDEFDFSTMNAQELQSVHNTDKRSNIPYGNVAAHALAKQWKDHAVDFSESIPLCMASDLSRIGDYEPNPNFRRNVNKNIRSGGNGATRSQAVSKTPGKRKESGDDGDNLGGTIHDEDIADEGRKARKRRKTAAKPAVVITDEEGRWNNDEKEDRGLSGGRGGIKGITSGVYKWAIMMSLIHYTPDMVGSVDISWQHAAVSAYVCDHTSIASVTEMLEECISDEVMLYSQTDSDQMLQQVQDSLRRMDLANVYRIKTRLHWEHLSLAVGMTCQRGLILLVNMASWQWIWSAVEKEYKKYSSTPREDGWLGPVFQKLDDYIDNPRQKVVITPPVCIPGHDQPSNIYTIKERSRATYLSRDLEQFKELLEPVLSRWFGFPDTNWLVLKAQAKLCSDVAENLGYWCLFLPGLWEVCQRIHNIAGGKSTKLSPAKFKKWFESFENHFSSVVTDRELEQTECLGELIEDVTDAQIDLYRLRMVMETAYKGESSCIDREALGGARLIDTSSEIDHPLGHTFVPSHLDQFLHQISILLPILEDPWNEPRPPSLSEGLQARYVHRFQQHVFRNGDKKLPFRNMAPSRRAVLDADSGPFSPNLIRTRQGFFSALVHRAITHHTPFLLDHEETYFHDAEDFRKRMKQKKYRGQPATFFCDKSAYGSPTKRSVDNAPRFWESAGDPRFNSWLVNDDEDTSITFLDLVKLLRNSEAFPTVGALTGYLLAADYAISGIVEMPSFEDMGGVIFDLKKGGVTGLRLLGCDCSSREKTISAFVELDAAVREELGEDSLIAMDYNPFVLEHMLCKFKRLSIQMYYRILKYT
ncbi:hypothetical protein BKA70DRAFT_1223557 [Coprinopsis sp. MPI-PUGE-AT-0042]|nr:hypothetical protein BKA70DRAFT_1428147 [Coprinopsis sp. MPI-PUGE-AT-0042]KAH6907196.1 hypothetical protein BKA70DRAFT_1223557 [Coprinopsis sp. MPI-PUGE-AT-0042]